MDKPIETVRLTLRPFKEDDLSDAFSWLGDPRVMRFTPGGPDRDMAQTAARIAIYQRHQAEHGFSKWIIVDRNSGQPIGDAGLLFVTEHDWIDFGYRLARLCWGHGLATEAATAWVERAFAHLMLPCLVSIVHPDNHASIRVLRKLRFVEERRAKVMGMNSIVYRLTAPASENRIGARQPAE
jgi:RimJ/RimL family protein N-acetyltransferase